MRIIKQLSNFRRDFKVACDYITNNRFYIKNNELIISILLIEDRKFFIHHGVSFKSLLRAFVKSYGGGSTINMQLVRTLTGRRELTIRRKIRECFLSIAIDFKYSKKDIINSYISCAYFGVGINGFNEMTNSFFDGKSSSELSLNDCFFIASLLKRPYPGRLYYSWIKNIYIRMEYIRHLYCTNEQKIRKEIK
ncbi:MULTISPECIES: biosynthetic peptidoglycan transglycosylase [Providencia]|uniref:biosynthetic peptidoglycan transglycosylase n=1 Tax=Providencia TaxID=586 RepID=UPI00143CC930|nr:transglycosylase domain-containing protein [Providencia huaxiensis]MBQ0589583.1 transglycosylase domain-containing protein [Providencia huaxiensis]MBZ3681048.1 transglycosylase domain-containing protein [Providencia rettgeri]QLR01621.1 transglycosylase domain-containing protein [Providencia rettgeri]